MLIEGFKKQLNEELNFLSDRKLLLALSGGVDSVVLFDLLKKSHLNFSVAHCNFKLRAEDSDQDAHFVESLCISHSVSFFIKDFDAKDYADNNTLSIQMAARELRYNWFHSLIKKHKFDYLLTAHHLDDNIETFIINLSRGSGILGLAGMPSNDNKIVRPLLKYPKDVLISYAEKKDLKWREDKSNKETKYLRNNIRHKILPALVELPPNFYKNFNKSISYINEVNAFLENSLDKISKELILKKNNKYFLSLKKLRKQQSESLVLHYVFKKFGSPNLEELKKIIIASTGSEIITDSHRILKDREYLIIKPIEKLDQQEYLIDSKSKKINSPINLSIKSSIKALKTYQIALDEDKISYPLKIRRPKQGDYFYPLGMNGKKKLSKYFKDQKFNKFEKEEAWLLCNHNQEIIWIINHQLDNRFKLSPTTKKVLNLKLC